MFSSQPLSIGGVIDAGVSLYGSIFKQTLKLSALAGIPYALASLAMSMSIGNPEAIDSTDQEAALEASMEMLGVMAIYFPLVYLALCFMIAVVARRIVALARSEPISDGADFRFGLKLMIPLTLMMIAYFLLIMLGFGLLVVPGVILSVSLSLFIYVPIFEDRSAWSSLHRSHKLIWRGNWWRCAAALTVMLILAMVVGGCFSILLGGLAVLKLNSDYTTLITLVEGIGTWAMMIVITPLSAAMALVLYNDLVLRREGDDLDSRLAELDDNTLEA